MTKMSPAEKQYFDALMAGSDSGTGIAAVVRGATSLGASFNVYRRSSVLAQLFRTTDKYLRFNSSILHRVNKFAIFITAHQWTAQDEWF